VSRAAKVLLIDDDKDFQASTKSLLESHGYTVIQAYSGKEGLRNVVDHKPDVIVLDIIMESDSEGYGVNAAIKHEDKYTEYREIPIIMVSSIQSSPHERFPQAIEVGMIQPNRYFTKPLDIPGFLEVVDKAAGKR